MPVEIRNIRVMRGMGIFAERAAKAESLDFKKFNLIYGFNGSGKSTLSRLFASLQLGSRHPRLPDECEFEIELGDGSVHACPASLAGLERNLVVFNGDFVDENLLWSSAKAKPVFYIGKEQAGIAAQLAKEEASLPAAIARQSTASNNVKSADKSLATFKRERARSIAERLALRNRKYEAPQLTSDYDNLSLSEKSVLSDELLARAIAITALDSPPAQRQLIDYKSLRLPRLLQAARTLAERSMVASALAELDQHPAMLNWLKEGHEYHVRNSLSECLHCGNAITPERRELLSRALDSQLQKTVNEIGALLADLHTAFTEIGAYPASVPPGEAIAASSQQEFVTARDALLALLNKARALLEPALSAIEEKRDQPSLAADTSKFSTDEHATEMDAQLSAAFDNLNRAIKAHNALSEEFDARQKAAQDSIKGHYLQQTKAEYDSLKADCKTAGSESEAAVSALAELRRRIDELRSSIREHGPAASQINKLVRSYLGHGELAIAAVDQGYEIHRHGKVISGMPSEGEKTAIALCYFLSLIEAEGRKIKDTIVVVDDPISSLDTKALNFAASLVKSRLSGAAQLFVLTHNQNFMNVFRKDWKGKADPRDGTDPTATMLFIDVTMPMGQSNRTSALVKMSRLLREYDSEYHFLAQHLFRFSEAPAASSEYVHLMPNVMRRVLDVFLAFRCPGSSGLQGKITQLCTEHKTLDADRVAALERLSQVESHSDNIDDLISFSSMTVEETEDAAKALLNMIKTVDEPHYNALKKLCAKP